MLHYKYYTNLANNAVQENGKSAEDAAAMELQFDDLVIEPQGTFAPLK